MCLSRVGFKISFEKIRKPSKLRVKLAFYSKLELVNLHQTQIFRKTLVCQMQTIQI